MITEEIEFEAFDYRDNFAIEIWNDDNLVGNFLFAITLYVCVLFFNYKFICEDTAIERVANFVLLPVHKACGDPSLYEDPAPSDIDIRLTEEDWKWAFINFSNKKLEFLIRF